MILHAIDPRPFAAPTLNFRSDLRRPKSIFHLPHARCRIAVIHNCYTGRISQSPVNW